MSLSVRLATGGESPELGGSRTDTIMVVHIPESGAATMVSLPRDSYVPIPGYGRDKLNASFSFGGPQLLVQTVEEATVNALVANDEMVGRDGHRSPALPRDRVAAAFAER